MGCNTSAVASNADGVIPVNGFVESTKTRILQDDVVDFCLNRNDLTVTSVGSLSTWKFLDGGLGVRDGSVVTQRLRNLSCGELFEDENFPATRESLCFTEQGSVEYDGVVWKRPWELSDCPRLFVDGTSRSDVKQGLLGDCWFLSACAAVATRQELIEKVINPKQPLFGDGYQGVLVISFWRFGEWVKVYVDDRLPTRDGALIFASCTDPNEFWLSIVEKAFAKLHGSYEALEGGHALEAFVDLTGGIAEKMDIKPDQFNQLETVFKHGAFITCSRKSHGGHGSGRCEGDAKGLIEGHAYTVTCVAVVRLLNGKTVHLVRIRNPWGNSVEWEGDWNDKCENWNEVSIRDKMRLRVTAHADGEFWMSFDDFKDEFVDITVATLGPDFDRDGLTDTPRQMEIVRGSWIRNVTAGGSRNNLEKFSTNPQFLLHLKESDSNDCDDGMCVILVGLMQEHRRSEKGTKLAMLPISFFIYKGHGRFTAGLIDQDKCALGRELGDNVDYVVWTCKEVADKMRQLLQALGKDSRVEIDDCRDGLTKPAGRERIFRQVLHMTRPDLEWTRTRKRRGRGNWTATDWMAAALPAIATEAEKPNERLGPEYFLCVEEEASSGDFTNEREVIVRAHLQQGYYVIIPATFHPDSETDFMIRIFALKPFTLTEIIHEW